jgi:GTP-binding protein
MICRKRSRLSILAAAVALALSIPEFATSFSTPRVPLTGAGTPSTEKPAPRVDTDDYSFFDEASIYVRAGSGGQGSSTYKKAKKGANGIPDGGAGGQGGGIVLVVDESLNTLAGLSKRALRPNAFGGGGGAASSKRLGHSNLRERLLSFTAENGRDGGRMFDNGRGGEDCIVRVPPGTVVSIEMERNTTAEAWDHEWTDEEGAVEDVEAQEEDPQEEEPQEEEEEEASAGKVLYDLREVGALTFDEPTLLVARGGNGGDGTASRRDNKRRCPPVGGERFRLRLTLKIVADLALVGVPNAGKSTFLASVTRAKPKIADYPFTTVVPNLGVWIPPYRNDEGAAGSAGLVLCDVPGLVQGAADGVGLGLAFLRHVERCRAILHIVDATSDDPVSDYKMVNDEIIKYGKEGLANMPQVVVVNKVDAAFGEIDDKDEGERLRKELEENLKAAMPHSRLMWMSAKEKDGVEDLMTRMAAYLRQI